MISRWPYRVREPKDPSDELDYLLDWTDWLDVTETIIDSDWEASSGLISVAEFADKTTRAWLSGGVDGTEITMTNTITTSSAPVARVASRSLIIKVENR